MSVTLSTEMEAATSAQGRRPGWLVKIGASTYLSSFGDVTAMDLPWVGAAFEISGLGQGGELSEGGRIVFRDPTRAWQALHLNGELSDVPCLVWAADLGALGVGGPVLKFSGSLDNSRARPMRAEVHVDLVPSSPGAPQTPRLTVGPETGSFTQIPPGTVLRVGNSVITIEDGQL